MTIIIGLLIPFIGTIIGAAFVFFMKDEMSPRLQKTLLGFASGVMVAASVWSLLIPAMDMEVHNMLFFLTFPKISVQRVCLHEGYYKHRKADK